MLPVGSTAGEVIEAAEKDEKLEEIVKNDNFEGWLDGTTLITDLDGWKVTGATTLTAKYWTPETVTVTFYTDSTGDGTAKQVTYGEAIPEAVFAEVEEGLDLKGWSTVPYGTQDFPKMFDKSTVITEATSLFAVYKEEAKIVGHQLVLGGRIGVNFYANLPGNAEAKDYPDAKMTFTVCGKESVCSIDPDEYIEYEGAKLYKYTCYVTSVEMADDISVVYDYGGETTVTETYSVEAFIKSEAYKAWTPELQQLVTSLADYGHYVQPFLARVNGWTVGKEHKAMDTFFTPSYDKDTVKAAATPFKTVTSFTADIANAGSALVLDDTTTMKFVILPASGYTGAVSVTMNGEPVTATLKDGMYEVLIPDIAAEQLDNKYDFAITTTAGVSTVTAYPLGYVYATLNNDTSAPDAVEAVESLFGYYAAAQAVNPA
jgi:hypothetical protein